MTALLKSKESPEVNLEVMAKLPYELREMILGMTDPETMLAFKLLTKADEGQLGSIFTGMDKSSLVWLEFATVFLGLKNIKAEDAEASIVRLREDLREYTYIPLSSTLFNSQYKKDKRFIKIIDLRSIADLRRGRLSRDDMKLIPAWREAQNILDFWAGMELKMNIEIKFHGVLKPLGAAELIHKAKTFDLWVIENKDKFAQIKKLDLEMIHDSLTNCTSLEDLELANIQSFDFPEFIGQMTSLKRLAISHSLFKSLDSISKLSSLEDLSLNFPLKSVDFIGNLANLKRFAFVGDLNDLMSPQAIENIKKQKDLKFHPLSLNKILKNLLSDEKANTQIKCPKYIKFNSLDLPDNLTSKFLGDITLDEVFFLREFLEARDTLVVWDKLARMIVKPIDFLRDSETCEAVVVRAKGFSAWVKENKKNLQEIIELNLRALKLTYLPSALWDIGFQIEVLDLEQNEDLIFPEALLSLKDSLQEFEFDQENPPNFVRELDEAASLNKKNSNNY